VTRFRRALHCIDESPPLSCAISPPLQPAATAYVPAPPTSTNVANLIDIPLLHTLMEVSVLLYPELRDYLARYRSVLVRAEDAIIGKLQVMPFVV
jgi:hypothetical protein